MSHPPNYDHVHNVCDGTYDGMVLTIMLYHLPRKLSLVHHLIRPFKNSNNRKMDFIQNLELFLTYS